jgi:hypothetical protein
MQDLIKATIWLEKDITAPSPGTLPGEGGPAPTPETDSKTPTRPTVQAREPRTEIAALLGRSAQTRTGGNRSPSTFVSERYRTMKTRRGTWRARPRGTSCMTTSIKFHLCNKSDNFKWALVVVYSPAQDKNKETFLAELVNMCSHENLPLLIGGDYNILRHPSEKNNDRYS